MTQTNVWIGKAFCALTAQHESREHGFHGAIFVFVCLAADISECVTLLQGECEENQLLLKGFEHLFDKSYLDRDLSEYEEELLTKSAGYPVQFRDVHFFKSDT